MNDELKFDKSQLLHCQKYKSMPDVVMAVIDADKTYTLAEADEIINGFLKRKVN